MEGDIDTMFEKAAKYVELYNQNFDTAQLLNLYGFYKQATYGPCNTPKPSWHQFEAKKKWHAWSQCGQISEQEARRKYVLYLNEIDKDWYSKHSESDSSQSYLTGSTVSSLRCHKDDDISENDKTIFDWVKENNIDKVKELICDRDINCQDSDGLTLLHWAADRGFLDMVRYLILLNANVNSVDADGQTALHYAASCGHAEVIQYLIEAGSNLRITDSNGLMPYQVCDDSSIRCMLLPE